MESLARCTVTFYHSPSVRRPPEAAGSCIIEDDLHSAFGRHETACKSHPLRSASRWCIADPHSRLDAVPPSTVQREKVYPPSSVAVISRAVPWVTSTVPVGIGASVPVIGHRQPVDRQLHRHHRGRGVSVAVRHLNRIGSRRPGGSICSGIVHASSGPSVQHPPGVAAGPSGCREGDRFSCPDGLAPGTDRDGCNDERSAPGGIPLAVLDHHGRTAFDVPGSYSPALFTAPPPVSTSKA